MWYGAWLLPLFMATALAFAYLLLRPSLPTQPKDGWSRLGYWLRLGNWQGEPWLKPLAWVALLSGLSIALYTGMETMAIKPGHCGTATGCRLYSPPAPWPPAVAC